MKYEIKNWNNRTVFVFRNTLKTFEDFLKIIDAIIKPEYKGETETTSWTQSFVFLKSGIKIYFENFYDDENPFYSFELFPFGKCNESDLLKLKQMMDDISKIN
jgi:hypothetical protein